MKKNLFKVVLLSFVISLSGYNIYSEVNSDNDSEIPLVENIISAKIAGSEVEGYYMSTSTKCPNGCTITNYKCVVGTGTCDPSEQTLCEEDC